MAASRSLQTLLTISSMKLTATSEELILSLSTTTETAISPSTPIILKMLTAMLLILQMLMVKLQKSTPMTLSALKRTSMKTIPMRSVTAVNTTILKRVRFILERDTITRLRVDLLAGIHMRVKMKIRLVLTCILIVIIIRFFTLIQVEDFWYL